MYDTGNGEPCLVTSKELLTKIQACVAAMGRARLGFGPLEIGTHSIRSAAEMSMFLADMLVYTIMLLGRWSSDAFLHYICCQVQQFSSGISARMIISEDFFTIPERASHDDPRVSGNHHNFLARSHCGLDVTRLLQQPSFALFY
jgi:hypothetical protein